MKKNIIVTISSIAAAIVISLLGQQSYLSEKQLETVFIEIGSSITKSSENESENNTIIVDEVPWSFGDFDTSVENIIHHYEKHGKDVDVDSPQEYYDLANDIIEDEDSIRIDDYYYENSVDFIDLNERLLVGLNPTGSINTLYSIESDAKLKKLLNYHSHANL